MKIAHFAAMAALATSGVPGISNAVPSSHTISSNVPTETICAVKQRSAKPRKARIVAITATPVYNFEFGYFVQDPAWPQGCKDTLDGTGSVRMDFPQGKTIRDFPDLAATFTQEYMGQHIGHRTLCVCVGRMTYADYSSTFTLLRVDKLWVE